MSFFTTHPLPACVRAIVLYALALCTVGAAASAQPAEPAGSGAALSLAAAIRQTLQGNPDLAEAGHLLRAADARIAQAGQRPAAELSVEVENVLGTGSVQGFSGGQASLALSQVIELGGRRERRTEVAGAARDTLAIGVQAHRLDVLAEVTRRFVEVAAGQERLALSRRAVDLAEGAEADVRRRVEAGRAPEVDLHRAGIARSRALLAQEHAEHELLSARHRLAAMWGATQAGFGEVTADYYRMPEPQGFDDLVARLRGNPDFLQFASQERLRDAELRLAESRRRPDVEFALGVRRLQDTRDEALLASVSVPLFSARRATEFVAEAQSRRAGVDAARQAAFVRTQAQLFELYQELRHALNEVAALREEVMPALETVLGQARAAYRSGRYAYSEWADAQRELLDAQWALIESAADAHRYLAEIERLTGEPVAAPRN
ncbi:MAG: TolC family protein [Sinimarinibacterium flocculans]|uniref:TolC family protein n=1 Tax=Sinimarinibacterium flocculans TaxID=985250 RepID=UPI003C6450C9